MGSPRRNYPKGKALRAEQMGICESPVREKRDNEVVAVLSTGDFRTKFCLLSQNLQESSATHLA
ncbi:hypothetical protein BVX97_05125 [bacterium E08(2017)]|nr:hypothetical protein BVX97_05125 [bacterium E08(2017)]